MTTKCILISVVLMMISIPSHALRCGNKLIGHGDYEYKVKKYCGTPTAVYEQTIYHRSGRSSHAKHELISGHSDTYSSRADIVKETPVVVWIYNFGPRRMIQKITFTGGSVIEIKTSGYGY